MYGQFMWIAVSVYLLTIKYRLECTKGDIHYLRIFLEVGILKEEARGAHANIILFELKACRFSLLFYFFLN